MENNCCQPKNKKGILSGLLYGLFPHVFCVGFIVFSIIGASTAAIVFKKFLLIPYFFHLLIFVSFLFATISAIFYLRRNNCCCFQEIKKKWRYLTILYGITILTNLLMFLVIFPALTNLNSDNQIAPVENLTNLSIKVQIPCSGHAPLIVDELKNNNGVASVKFVMPNIFEIKYNPENISPEKIISLEIFKIYKATFL